MTLIDESIVFVIAICIGYALHPLINSMILLLANAIMRQMWRFNSLLNKLKEDGLQHRISNKDK